MQDSLALVPGFAATVLDFTYDNLRWSRVPHLPERPH